MTKQQFINQIAAEKANQLPIVNGDEWRNNLLVGLMIQTDYVILKDYIMCFINIHP